MPREGAEALGFLLAPKGSAAARDTTQAVRKRLPPKLHVALVGSLPPPGAAPGLEDAPSQFTQKKWLVTDLSACFSYLKSLFGWSK